MDSLFSVERNLNDLIGPDDQYCNGYGGDGSYVIASVMGHGTFKKTFSHAGSDILDHIVAYDRAEISSTYIGQINMITVSSFCGPRGLIWGYDIAKVDMDTPAVLTEKDIHRFKEIKITNGAPLRHASQMLLGTNDDRHFPLLPGSHVPCAGKFRFFEGPTTIYSAIAIGIPENRDTAACLLMEDVGQMLLMNGDGSTKQMARKLTLNMIESVLEVGVNQRVKYKEVLVDVSYREVLAGEVGCALVAAPYMHLAKDAYDKALPEQSLEEWALKKRKHFLHKK